MNKTSFNLETKKVVDVIRNIFSEENKPHERKSVKVILSIWVLTLISIVTKYSDADWIKYTQKLSDIGYRIPDETVEDLVSELNDLTKDICN